MNSSQRLAAITVASAIGVGCALLVLLNPRLAGRYLLDEVGMGLVMGTLFGQITLAAAWNAFGPLPLLRRLPLSLAWVATLVVAFGSSLILERTDLMILVPFAGILLGLWLLVQLPLWYFVLVRGWRLRDCKEAAAIPDVRFRYFGIRELMVLIAVLAALFGCGWATFVYLETYNVYGTSRDVAVQILMSAMMVVITVPLVVAALLPRGAILATVVMALIMGVATLGEVLLFKAFDLDLGGPFDQTTLLPVINASTAAWVCAVILGMRLGGYGLGTTRAAVPASPAKRRWVPRFGLRTLLIAMTVLGIGLGYVGMLLQRVRHQRLIVAKIEAAGGEVRYNWQFGMGAQLDSTYEDSVEYEAIELGETSDGRTTQTRRNIEGEIIGEEIETPSGPWIMRKMLGDDVFAHVGSVRFAADDSQSPRQFDPSLLLELPQLKVVSLRGPQVNDEWIACIAQIPQLRAVNLWGDEESTATGDGLAQLRTAKELWHLGLHGTWVRDETVAGIAPLTQLQSLQFNEGPNLTSFVFANLTNLTDLRELYIRRAPKIDDHGTESLSRLTKLRRLTIMATSTTDTTLSHLPGLTQLELLELSVTKVGDPGMEYIATLPKLKRLTLAGTSVGDVGLESLSHLPQLRYLHLGGTAITDAGLPTLGRMTQLQTLSLWETSVTDCGVMQLGTLKNLRDLSLGESQVTDLGGEEIRKALPRRCKLYW